jgi:hypothetical protein
MRFNEFNISEDIKLPGKPQPGGASDGVVSHTPMKLGPIKYDLYDGPPPTVKQSASSNLPVNYQIAPSMRPQPGPPKPVPNWVEKSALGKYQDPADRAWQEKPAYQRKGVPEPVIKPAPGTKPTNNNVGTERPGNQAKPNYSLANDPVGKATAGEPTMGQKPNSVPSNVKPGIEAGADIGAKTLGKKLLSRAVPYASSAYDAYDAYDRVKKGDYVGATIAGTGAVGGLVPGLGAPVALGAAGINMARDAYNNAPANSTNLNPVTSAANAAAAKKGNVGRGGLAPAPAPVAKPAPAPAEPKLGSWQEIAKLNNITDPRKLKAGSRIELPNGQGSYYVTKGDTLSGISQRLNTTGDPQYREPGSVNKTSVQPAPSTPASTNNDNELDRQKHIDRIQKQADDAYEKMQSPPTNDDSDNQLTNVIPNDRMAEENKSLNRIKSLAGLK